MSLYKPKDTACWWVQIHHAGQRIRRSTGQTDRKAAQREHDRIKASLWSQPKLTGHTWGKAVMDWVAAKERSESELLSLRKFGEHFKDRRLVDVTADDIDQALSFCRTVGTYTRYRTMVAAVLNLARKHELIEKVPVLKQRKGKKAPPRKWLTPDEWNVLYAELPAHLKTPALFSIETGLRQANVLQLRWERVSLERRLVWVEADEAKGGEAIATPLNDAALAVLTACRAAPPYRPKRGKGEPIISSYVFTFRGKPMKDVKTSFMAACIRAGLGEYVRVDGELRYRGFSWHGLRHTWATWHAQNGTPAAVLQELGAWADPRMVQNYAHHSPQYLASFAGNTRKTT